MFALYGEWGSGKSTILKYLEKELGSGEYMPIFFEAWHHEKDENLSLSLLDVIRTKIEASASDITKEIFKLGFSTLKSFTKGLKIKTPIFEIDGEKVLNAAEKEDTERNELISIYKQTEEFKKKFEEVENHILTEGKKKIIVFIDDLDRCEPENVLNLISAIKLFFTYGKNIVFLFGIDKKAVSQAVEIRYGKTIHSEIYLEKVFDVTFNMPKELNLFKFLLYIFPQQVNSSHFGAAAAYLEKFFRQIEFNTPRHLKKVINKYIILHKFTESSYLTGATGHRLLPYILKPFGDQNCSENELTMTIFVLYFIILHEFHHSKFIEIENYESKLSAWANIRYDQRTDRSQSMEFIISNMNNSIVIPNIRDINLKDLAKQSTPGPRPGQNIEIVHKFYQRFLAVFTPEETSSFTYLDLSDENFIKQFKYNNSNKILLNFCEFLLKEKAMILKLDDTHYKLWDLFEMAETLL